jgi:hypothetical protein
MHVETEEKRAWTLANVEDSNSWKQGVLEESDRGRLM